MPKKVYPDRHCSACGRLLPIEAFYKYRTARTKDGERFSPRCRPCTRKVQKTYRRPAGEAYDFGLRNFINHLRFKANRRIANAVTTPDLLKIWARQKGRCALTGWKMTTTRGIGVVRTNASIDRINPKGGYTLDNIQFVCVAANKAKFDLQTPEFLKLCRAVMARSARQSKKRVARCRTKKTT